MAGRLASVLIIRTAPKVFAAALWRRKSAIPSASCYRDVGCQMNEIRLKFAPEVECAEFGSSSGETEAQSIRTQCTSQGKIH